MADLQGVIRVAKASVDDRRRDLAALLRQAEDLSDRRLVLEQDLARERDIAQNAHSSECVYLGAYLAAVVARCRQIDAAAAAVAADIEIARGALGDAYRELRGLELADESRARRRAEARARRERDELDEVGLRRHRQAWSHRSSPPVGEIVA